MRFRHSAIGLVALLAASCGGPPAAQTGPGPAAGPDGAPIGTTVSDAGTGAAPATTPDGKTVFTFVLPKPGDQRTDRDSFVLALDVVATEGGKPVAKERTGQEMRNVKHTTIVATDGRAVTKKKVRYEQTTRLARSGDREEQAPSPLTGKTYLVELVKGATVVTRDDGQPISELEQSEVLEDNKNFGKPPRFATFVPKHPLSPGEKFTPPPEALEDMFGANADGKEYADAAFTFVGAEDRGGKRVGKFAFRTTMLEKGKGSRLTIKATGTVLLLVDTGWPSELAMSGSVALEAPGEKGQKIRGTGTVQMKLDVDYR